jgi:transposase-like protein
VSVAVIIAVGVKSDGRRVVSAFIATAFAQDTAETASSRWRTVADQIRPRVPTKLATIRDDAEPDVLAYMTFPKEHRAKLHSTDPIERLNGEIKRRTRSRHLPQRWRYRSLGRCLAAGTKRPMGSPARPIDDAGNHGAFER